MTESVDVNRLFTDRPEKTHPCHSCSGTGMVSKRYWLAPTNAVEGAPEGAILAVVMGSASIFEAMGEASDIARRAQRPVAFDFIDKVVVVRPDQDPNFLGRSWWIARYGETPEQTAARR